MDAKNAEPSLKPPPPRMSGMKTVLRYTGIPPSWLDKRPKLPSRNWLIFLSLTSTVIGYGVYDRRECRRIRQEYIEKVQHLAEEPLHPLDLPRQVVVYGSKWPGDEEYQQAVKYFRKYVKPVLVAAAVDFDMVSGRRLGDLSKRVAEDVRVRRRLEAGIDEDPEIKKTVPTYKPPSERYRRELEGGIVLVGRQTFKEFMAGLKNGWSNGLEKVDQEEELSRTFDEDYHFDEVDEDAPPPSGAPSYSPIFSLSSQSLSQRQAPSSVSESTPAPQSIPQQPPILFVPFSNRIGFTQIPLMIWDWFNQRHWVQSGSESAYRLVMNQTRQINVPSAVSSEFAEPSDEGGISRSATTQDLGDLDFDLDKERLYKSSLSKIPEEAEKSRKEFYDKLPERLATARALFRGTREPTKDELQNPPPTEVELRAERMKKELKWRNDVNGWNLVKPSTPIVWDERFRDALRVFTDPSEF
ncbi:hypothetical protein EST38_g3522 [Candolleomyces aberdarensis]|uniref:Mitochondrial import inner membrane translocase subunit TIM54 n=1 Tax=Candolleomyces aberdarensis TaxID=2316362 RepID=A0A4Q2DST3_9AGAR|nr:hypothetical protein EST38_g3522 [Candolleomyces aberdarensis]